MGSTKSRHALVEKGSTSRPPASARAEAEACTEAIRQRLKQIARDFWEVGELFRRVKDEEMYRELGYESFRDWLEIELAVAANQAYKMIRIVRAFVRGDAERVGVERADLLIGYAKLLGGDIDPGELVRADAPIGNKPVTQATVRELQSAIVKLRLERARHTARGKKAREAQRSAAELTRRVRRELTTSAALGRAVIAITRNEIVVRYSRATVERRLAGRGE